MRRFALILAVCLVLPAVSLGAGVATGDGALGCNNANGTIFVQGHGVIYGHFDSGTLMVLSYEPDDLVSVPAVSSAKFRFSKGSGVYSGSDVRFLLPSGTYTIELIGTGIDVSAVGKGSIVANGLGTTSDGSYSINGGKPTLLTKAGSNDTFGGPAATTTTTITTTVASTKAST